MLFDLLYPFMVVLLTHLAWMFEVSLPFRCCPSGVAGAVGGVCGCAGGSAVVLGPWCWLVCACVFVCVCVWCAFPGGGVCRGLLLSVFWGLGWWGVARGDVMDFHSLPFPLRCS